MRERAVALADSQDTAFVKQKVHEGDGLEESLPIIAAKQVKGGKGRGESAAGAVGILCFDARMLDGVNGGRLLV